MKFLIVKICLIALAWIASFNAVSVSAAVVKTADKTAQIATAESRINVNTATLEQLMTLPGIGESKAAAIISHRQTEGPFTTPDDLVKVKGIGTKLLAKLIDVIEAS
ncbi:ComEA family DNA-binding protein [Alteromonas gilva]|uniref:ComEA family DNA-binding protein n=1 Tax=Alteromonas gilva TaxID=2987522 RepID=A0ABT5L018_9ALTE|nr:ComEA family DNA-binding protein [Alteromonas gilva]MDC8830375.1 ComEA family DNA-binding protein [Alteromonas gilva]